MPAPPALLHTFPPGPRAYTCQVCSSIPSPDPLPPRVHLPASTLSPWFLRTGLTGKNCGKKGAQDPSLFLVLCHQVPNLIQQQAHILPSLPFATHTRTEALLVAFDITGQVLYSFNFPNFIPGYSVSLYSLQVTCPCFHLPHAPRSPVQASQHFARFPAR